MEGWTLFKGGGGGGQANGGGVRWGHGVGGGAH